MKRILLLTLFVMTWCNLSISQEKWYNDPRLTRIEGYDNGGKTKIEQPLDTKYEHKNTNVSVQSMGGDGVAIVYPNYMVHPSVYTQSEVPIVSHPTNKNILFASANWFNQGANMFSEGIYVTTNGGTSWFGWDTCRAAPIADHVGDPAPSIDMNGRFYMSYLQRGGGGGIYVSNSTDYGQTWANASLVTSVSSDKNHTVTINNPASPYNGNTIVSWSDFSATNPKIVVSVTSNNGTTWSPVITVQTPPAGVYAQGVNGAQGPNGEVYLVWQSPMAGSPYTGKYMGFSKSTDGGFTWNTNNNIYTCNGIRNSSLSPWSIRVNDFPWMGVDLTNGARRGWIYVVSADKNLAPAGSDEDIVLHRSTDGGTTWSAGIRVNQDALSNGKKQYMPALVVGTDGSVNIVYYDNRNTATNDSVEVYVARSMDGGTTWSEVLASDHKFRPGAISGLAGGYQGDYIGIAEGPGGSMFPYWADNSSGKYQAWTTKVVYATYPLNPFNLTTPAAGTRISTFPNTGTTYTFGWDTSASTASYKWRFSVGGVVKLQVEGSSNTLNFTSGQLDNMLAAAGVNQGDSLVGTWNVMAYRNNFPANDSLASTNGPRTLTLKRGKPLLTAFGLSNPENNSFITTSVFNNSTVIFNWKKSGDGTKYKVKWGSTLTDPRINTWSNGTGFDTVWTIANSGLDVMLGGLGVNPGDSLTGVWAVYAYSGLDSLKSVETWNLTMKRQAKGDYIIAYDSSSASGRAGKDTVALALGTLGRTFDLFNKGSQTSTKSMTFQGYNGVIWLGAATSVMSNVQKDSIKSYLTSGTAAKRSRLIVFGEDFGYQFGRTGSTYIDTTFLSQYCGVTYIADRPTGYTTGAGLVGDVINTGKTDSTAGTWPDVLNKSWAGGHRLYMFRTFNPADGNAYGVNRTNNSVVVFGSDADDLRNAPDGLGGSSVTRFLQGAFNYMDPIPVEMTSFTANANDNSVNLLWVTATETNNSGFAVERKSSKGSYEEVAWVKGNGSSTEMHTYAYTDKQLSADSYTYRLKQVDFDGSVNYSKEVNVDLLNPTVYALDQNYPNPFNPSTVIKYSIPQDGLVTLSVFNVLGEKMVTLVNDNMKAGKYEVKFDASRFASGIYLYRLDAGSFTSVKKMMLVK